MGRAAPSPCTQRAGLFQWHAPGDLPGRQFHHAARPTSVDAQFGEATICSHRRGVRGYSWDYGGPSSPTFCLVPVTQSFRQAMSHFIFSSNFQAVSKACAYLLYIGISAPF